MLPDLPVAAAGGGGDLPQPRHVQVVSADLAGLHGGLGLGPRAGHYALSVIMSLDHHHLQV